MKNRSYLYFFFFLTLLEIIFFVLWNVDMFRIFTLIDDDDRSIEEVSNNGCGVKD